MRFDRVTTWLEQLMGDLSLGLLYDVLLWAVAAVLVAAVVHYGRRWIDRQIEDVNQRHKLRKGIGYAGALLVLALGVALLLGRSVHVAAILGILGAGAAIALQDTARNFIGWIYITGRPGLGSGARVEVEGVEGEVIDVGLVKTTIVEVGHRVHGQQSSGRVVTIPNARFLDKSVHAFPDFSPYRWQELQFLLTFESDWKRGIEVLEELGREEHEQVATGARSGFRQLERRYAFKYGTLTPVVYLDVADSGVRLTLRYLTHIRQARVSADRVGRAMLDAVAQDSRLDFAYPTWRVYRAGEEGKPDGFGPDGG